jgi:pimeloyl-ACP methyl ester carboxylesterase
MFSKRAPRRGAPMPPTLPRGEVRAGPGRGELFVRTADCPQGALPVLLIHGWQATADLNFHPVFAPLAARHAVIAADLRGHGRSLYPEDAFTLEDAADDNAALLRDLDVTRCIVVGYSIGTAVAQVLVDRHPDVVAGLVLVGGELAPDRRPHEKVYDRAGGWQGTAQRTTSGRWGAHRLVDKAAKEHPAAEHLRGWLVAEMERGHTGSIRAAGRALARFDGRPIAGRHKVPTAVVITRRDRLVRPARQERLAQAWDAAVFDLDADHDAPLARPRELTAAVLDAIGSVADAISADAERAGVPA